MVHRTSGISLAISSETTESVLGKVALTGIPRNYVVVIQLAEILAAVLCATSLISRKRLTLLLQPPARPGRRNSLRNNLRLPL